jgi:hypothetical protein
MRDGEEAPGPGSYDPNANQIGPQYKYNNSSMFASSNNRFSKKQRSASKNEIT